jgi:ATP-dependent Clp protease ATP-binding subunit ClpA
MLGELRREIDAFERRQVAHALAEGDSYAAIARDLGLSRQAVHRRYRDLTTENLPLLLTPDAGRVLQHAREQAAALGAGEVGGEHVLLGALRAGVPAADALGVTPDRVRMHVEGMAPHRRLFLRAGDVNPAPRALLAAAADAARARRSRRIEAEDLLLAALAEPAGTAGRTLRALGADPDAVRAELAGRVA